jgi:IclR family acetate operon transcriptional repressor
MIQRGLQPCGRQRKVNTRALRDDLAEIRTSGFAYEDGQWVPGVRSVAAAILDASSRPVAAITAMGFVSEMPTERVPEVGRAVCTVARQIGRELGAPEA